MARGECVSAASGRSSTGSLGWIGYAGKRPQDHSFRVPTHPESELPAVSRF